LNRLTIVWPFAPSGIFPWHSDRDCGATAGHLHGERSGKGASSSVGSGVGEQRERGWWNAQRVWGPPIPREDAKISRRARSSEYPDWWPPCPAQAPQDDICHIWRLPAVWSHVEPFQSRATNAGKQLPMGYPVNRRSIVCSTPRSSSGVVVHGMTCVTR
jgi:hypothetical protein